MLKPLGTIPYSLRLKTEFRNDELWERWAKAYPFLFDDLDKSHARNQAHFGQHFHEWFAAIQLYHATGFHALVASYQFPKHKKKQDVLRRLWPKRLQEVVLGRSIDAGPQCPDLVMYAPDLSDWFFCEVKGPTDRLRPTQKEFFLELAAVAKRPVFELKLRPLDTGG